MVMVGADGTPSGRRKPSSEWRFHRDIYAARPEAGAVVHTHSPFATALACQEQGIPAFHYMVARFGGATCAAPPMPPSAPRSFPTPSWPRCKGAMPA
jgi:L-fuculose-phosphate aldolase